MPKTFFVLSRLLQTLSLAILALLPAAILAALVITTPRELLLSGALGDRPFTPETLPGAPLIWAALAVTFLQVAALLYALWQMSHLFANFGAGLIITPQSAQRLFRTGQGLAGAALLGILADPVQSVLLSWQMGPGQRRLVIGLSMPDILFLVAGGLLVLVGYAMREAVALQDENRSFV